MIQLLKYQIKLMKMFIDGDTYPYFMYLLDHDIHEEQSSIINDILIIFNHRMKSDLREYINENSEMINKLTSKLKHFNISEERLFSENPPTFNEFKEYTDQIMPEHVNAKYLLISLERQSMFKDLSAFLLTDAEDHLSTN
ncbi:hypothetical protein [Paenibacillus sp. 23TSA30-6]|uniref:hypothetical protein n=1 Tax=Paenibacillus sp. 23TSA30-6 TaxID=2546104 RepID=UPI0017884876|nr:hypothetical protein [Paenibacillus sp. 23TSA30-6]MBE0338367.1 hypothetical protein [Paenibacillus sp. 23TSA30-6]